MYLSKIKLNLASSFVRKGFNNSEELHKNVQSFFGTDRLSSKSLYRVQTIGPNAFLYVLSSKTPSESDNIGDIVGSKDITNFIDSFSNGNIFKFSCLAVPAKKISSNGGPSKRKFLRSTEEKIEWLNRQSAKSGFEIIGPIEAVSKPNQRVVKPGSSFDFPVTNFTGLLRITDSELFKTAYCNGIGPLKAYGVGMIMLMGAN